MSRLFVEREKRCQQNQTEEVRKTTPHIYWLTALLPMAKHKTFCCTQNLFLPAGICGRWLPQHGVHCKSVGILGWHPGTRTHDFCIFKASHWVAARGGKEPPRPSWQNVPASLNPFHQRAGPNNPGGVKSGRFLPPPRSYLSPSFFFSFCFLRTISILRSFHMLLRSLMGRLPTYFPVAGTQAERDGRESERLHPAVQEQPAPPNFSPRGLPAASVILQEMLP